MEDQINEKLMNTGTRDRNVRWYEQKIPHLSATARELLENYSKIPSNEVEDHIYKIRDEAWEIFPYPCIGGFRFLDMAISLSSHYPAIVSRLKTGNETLVDLGCMFGHDIRALVAAGAPSSVLYGIDLRPEYFSLGYKLFRDQDTLQSRFIAADIFNQDSELKELDGKVDIAWAGSFLHLFSWDQQLEVCKRIVKLLKPKEGSLVVGRQVGNVNPGELAYERNGEKRTLYRHDEKTFERLWKEVGEATGTSWKVEMEMLPERATNEAGSFEGESRRYWSPDDRRLRFSVLRE